jgi:hypothetical protein
LKRSFTPAEVKKLVQDNIRILKKYDSIFKSGDEETDKVYQALDQLFAQLQASGIDRFITMEEYDEKYQKTEILYGIFKVSIDKRITVVFIGINLLAGYNEWKKNTSSLLTKEIIPDNLKDKLGGKIYTCIKGSIVSKSNERSQKSCNCLFYRSSN